MKSVSDEIFAIERREFEVEAITLSAVFVLEQCTTLLFQGDKALDIWLLDSYQGLN